MIPPRFELVKNDLVRSLGLSPEEVLSLDKEFYGLKEEEPERGWSFGSFSLCLLATSFLYSNNSLAPYGFLLVLVLIYQLYFRLMYGRRIESAKEKFEIELAKTLSNQVTTWLRKNYFDDVKSNLLNMNFKSLRELTCAFTHRVYFESLKKTFDYGMIFENYDRAIRMVGNQPADTKPTFYELTPEISFCVDELFVSMKCDFRIIRSQFENSEVASIFSKCIEVVPFLDASQIRIKQWSSTKRFIFGLNNLNESTLLYLDTVRRKSRKKLLREKTSNYSKIGSATQRQDFRKNSDGSDSMSANMTEALSKPIDVEIVLDSLEKKRRSELVAMTVSKKYEFFQGRSPTDVSAQNLGYDLESKGPDGVNLKIEVKGLDTTGDVMLSANEVRALTEYRDSYYVYVADFCSGKAEQTLYRVKGLRKADLREQVVNYGFSLKEQNCQNAIKITIE